MTDPADPTPLPIQLQYEVPATLKPHDGEEATAWDYQGMLVTRRSCGAPMICIRCGQPAVKDFQKVFYWHPMWVSALLIFTPFWCIGAIAYLVVAFALQKKATIHFGICEAHHRNRQNHGWICAGIVLVAVVLFVGGLVVDSARIARPYRDAGSWLSMAAIVLFLYAIIHGSITRRLLAVKRIDDQYVYYKGAGEAFLRELPSF